VDVGDGSPDLYDDDRQLIVHDVDREAARRRMLRAPTSSSSGAKTLLSSIVLFSARRASWTVERATALTSPKSLRSMRRNRAVASSEQGQ
jgi:hypothetical protein